MKLIIVIGLLLAMGCNRSSNEAVKYADAPIKDIPVSTDHEQFSEFKKEEKTGCASDAETKEKLLEVQKSQKAASLKGTGSDCTVK